jgi:hypothetical protein
MKPAIGGFRVGVHVGKLCEPDKLLLRGINELSCLCRKCRVYTTEETSGDFASLRPVDELE